jgi:hypothetical protein
METIRDCVLAAARSSFLQESEKKTLVEQLSKQLN